MTNPNHARYMPEQRGFYESFFLRANHPERKLAFWIRYTVFSPKSNPSPAIGELWAIVFNGETQSHTALKQEFSMQQCRFDNNQFHIEVGQAALQSGQAHGSLTGNNQQIEWDLTFTGDSPTLYLFPMNLYETRLPSAKSLVALPMACFNGYISVNGERITIQDWVGSQNHNWGTKHTDHYAWGQVAGFDTHPDSFMELATARLKIGPVWTPPMTLLVLRHEGKEYRFNSLARALRNRGTFDYFNWQFTAQLPDIFVTGEISAPKEAFVGLNYYNPPGGSKTCLNTKIASCEIKVTRNGQTEQLSTTHRAAFEILTDDNQHGMAIRA